ncbi:ZP2 protein, partial [Polypterus senegalus]|nr:ZP2 protein [Polypterus senegalus]
LTVLCYYDDRADRNLSLTVLTNAPPAPAINKGNLTVVLRAYPDEMYRVAYRDQDYPVVKYLRDPIYLEVQVLNRQDPNIELVLENCWATASPNPISLPRWAVIAAGCAYGGDDYPTVMHLMSDFTGIQFPSHYKRFDVKAFAFVSSGAALSSVVRMEFWGFVVVLLCGLGPLFCSSCRIKIGRVDFNVEYCLVFRSISTAVR